MKCEQRNSENISRRSEILWKKKSKFAKQDFLLVWQQSVPENEMFQQLTFDEGGRHWVYSLELKKIKTKRSCFVFMHNKLPFVSILLWGTNSCCFLAWPSAQWCNIFQKSNSQKQEQEREQKREITGPFKKHFYQTVHFINNNSNGMIWGAKHNIKVAELVCNESNSKCQRWIHVSNHLQKKSELVFFNFCNVIALLCWNCVFYEFHILSRLVFFTSR